MAGNANHLETLRIVEIMVPELLPIVLCEDPNTLSLTTKKTTITRNMTAAISMMYSIEVCPFWSINI